MASPKTMINLLDYTLPELTDWMQNELGEPKFRAVQVWQWIWQRSEEHTSELQSHSRISYAVFCLKKNFFNDTATTEIYTLSLHDALPI